MRRLLILLALTAGAVVAGAGCSGRGTVAYTSSGYYSQPSLAYVAPGVYVVEDYGEPVFYSNNLYWRYDNGRWFRSRHYDRGWTYWARPPRAVMSIDRPYAYVRYRSPTRYRATRDTYREPGGVRVRDHRTRSPYYR